MLESILYPRENLYHCPYDIRKYTKLLWNLDAELLIQSLVGGGIAPYTGSSNLYLKEMKEWHFMGPESWSKLSKLQVLTCKCQALAMVSPWCDFSMLEIVLGITVKFVRWVIPWICITSELPWRNPICVDCPGSISLPIWSSTSRILDTRSHGQEIDLIDSGDGKKNWSNTHFGNTKNNNHRNWAVRNSRGMRGI